MDAFDGGDSNRVAGACVNHTHAIRVAGMRDGYFESAG